jgi:ACS family hexuronate transporter-like MFS transporter
MAHFLFSPSRQKRLSETELNYIESDVEDKTDEEATAISWGRLLTKKQTWAFYCGQIFY